MGRLQTLALAALVVAISVSCTEAGERSPAPSSRSEQIVTSATAAATTAPSAHVAPPAPSVPRTLCSPLAGRTLAKIAPTRVDVQGNKSDGRIDLKAARFTWVDFFASWCGPCKEELPRLESFAARLSKDGVDVQLVHVSLDDDLRQLTAFFGKDTRSKSSLWLPDGPAREGFLASLKMKAAPALPEHAIVSQDGSAKCFVDGAFTDADYPQLLEALRR